MKLRLCRIFRSNLLAFLVHRYCPLPHQFRETVYEQRSIAKATIGSEAFSGNTTRFGLLCLSFVSCLARNTSCLRTSSEAGSMISSPSTKVIMLVRLFTGLEAISKGTAACTVMVRQWMLSENRNIKNSLTKCMSNYVVLQLRTSLPTSSRESVSSMHGD